MQKNPIFKRGLLSARLLGLIAILIGFLLLLIAIWLWCDFDLAKLDKAEPSEGDAIHSTQ